MCAAEEWLFWCVCVCLPFRADIGYDDSDDGGDGMF